MGSRLPGGRALLVLLVLGGLGLAFGLRPSAGSGAAPPGVGAGAPGDAVVVSPRVVAAESDGLRLESFDWAAGGSRGPGWLVSAPRATAKVSVVAGDAVRRLSDFVVPPGPVWAAVNGGFYEDGPMGLVVSGGREVHPLTSRGGSGVLAVGPDGPRILHRDAWAPGPTEALQSIDRLVDGGASLVQRRVGAHRDARTAVALSADRVWLVVTAAQESVGRGDGGPALHATAGRGMTLAELASFLVTELHAEAALNLDGAVSTQFVAQVGGTSARWVGERGTINAVVLTP